MEALERGERHPAVPRPNIPSYRVKVLLFLCFHLVVASSLFELIDSKDFLLSGHGISHSLPFAFTCIELASLHVCINIRLYNHQRDGMSLLFFFLLSLLSSCHLLLLPFIEFLIPLCLLACILVLRYSELLFVFACLKGGLLDFIFLVLCELHKLFM
jgi:hypothetical protein